VPTHRSIEQKRIDQEDPNFSLSSCPSDLGERNVRELPMRFTSFVAVVALATGALGCSPSPTYRTAGGAAVGGAAGVLGARWLEVLLARQPGLLS
jgi:hypothetical protein